ncbi:hypothetical protein [Streptomyces sp. NPDC007264]|uniref:hypothetical protein n=1 Tax=Streptomyces sp. NPDC007264 TaxID=3364777 RepID=UPI0036DAD597
MSPAPAREPREPASEPRSAPRSEPKSEPRSAPKDALVFDDPLSRPSSDDTDQGWGERPAQSAGSAADLARFLDEKPPHHL